MRELHATILLVLALLVSSCKRHTDSAQFTDEDVRQARTALATAQRDDEVAAAVALHALSQLEKKGKDDAAQFLVQTLRAFNDANFPSTESSKKLRQKINKYAATSPAFRSTTDSK